MKSLDQKLIIYDSNCKVCTSLRDVVLKLTGIPEDKVMAYKDLTAELVTQVDPARFKNGMALVDISGRSTLYGGEGVAHIFSSQYRVVNFLLRFSVVFRLFNFFYNTQAYNRYIIATPRSTFACDCHPDKVIKYRVSYIMVTTFLSVGLTAWLGITLKPFFTDISNIEAMSQMLLIAGTGWILQILLAIAILRERALDYIGHLGSIMVVGLLILVPWMLLQSLGGITNAYLPAISVLASSIVMLYLHYHRARYLELHQGWTVSWLFLLQGTAFGWIYIFHIN